MRPQPSSTRMRPSYRRARRLLRSTCLAPATRTPSDCPTRPPSTRQRSPPSSSLWTGCYIKKSCPHLRQQLLRQQQQQLQQQPSLQFCSRPLLWTFLRSCPRPCLQPYFQPCPRLCLQPSLQLFRQPCPQPCPQPFFQQSQQLQERLDRPASRLSHAHWTQRVLQSLRPVRCSGRSTRPIYSSPCS